MEDNFCIQKSNSIVIVLKKFKEEISDDFIKIKCCPKIQKLDIGRVEKQYDCQHLAKSNCLPLMI